MANYVSNRVVCKKTFFNKYFLDFYALGQDSYEYCREHRYISFNKLFDVSNVTDYFNKYGEVVCYSLFYSVNEINDEYVEVKFYTKKYYPICAIQKAIEMDHDIVWYAIEENMIYISKFEWNDNKVIERTLNIENDSFNDWYNKKVNNMKINDDIDDNEKNAYIYLTHTQFSI